MLTYFITFLICVSTILIFDVIGAIASRKLNFNYIILMPISLLIYFGVGIYTTVYINDMAAITMTGLVGIVESIVGLKIANRFNANWGGMDIESMTEEMYEPVTIIFMSLFCMFIGWLGSCIV